MKLQEAKDRYQTAAKQLVMPKFGRYTENKETTKSGSLRRGYHRTESEETQTRNSEFANRKDTGGQSRSRKLNGRNCCKEDHTTLQVQDVVKIRSLAKFLLKEKAKLQSKL